MPVDPFDDRFTNRPPGPDFLGPLVIAVLIALSWLLWYALSHGWFKTIPI